MTWKEALLSMSLKLIICKLLGHDWMLYSQTGVSKKYICTRCRSTEVRSANSVS